MLDTDELMIGCIILDDTTKKVSVDGNEVTLTPMEFGILKMLMKQPGKVFTSAEIYKMYGMMNQLVVNLLSLFIFVTYVKRLRLIHLSQDISK